ncbi:MAG: hypothetical protein ACKVS7_12645 [Gemmatimonadaceae bacterium]
MTQDDELEQQLRPAFDALRHADAQATPAFDGVLARARAQAAAQPAAQAVAQAAAQAAPQAEVAVGEPARRATRGPWRLVAYAAPLAAAAGLALWLAPDRAADREFERAVTDWSRTERALPSDGLLAVPGSEYLRQLPVLGIGAGRQRGPL